MLGSGTKDSQSQTDQRRSNGSQQRLNQASERQTQFSSRSRRPSAQADIADRLVSINRVSKTVKGGKRFGFAALVVVGDQKGSVGFGKGKAKEVPEAIRKATEQARRQMVRVKLREGRTLHHDVEGKHGAGKVILRTAPEGTGIIAGGPMRAVFEMLGVKDVVSKSIGSSNPYNMIRATMDGLRQEQSPRQVAVRRGKKVADILPSPNTDDVSRSYEERSIDSARSAKNRESLATVSKVSPNSSGTMVKSGRYHPNTTSFKKDKATTETDYLQSRRRSTRSMTVADAARILTEVEERDHRPNFGHILEDLVSLNLEDLREDQDLRSEVLRLPDAVWRALLRNLDEPAEAEAAAKCLIAVTRPDTYSNTSHLGETRAVNDFEEILLEAGNDAFVSMRFAKTDQPNEFIVEAVVRKRAPFTINGIEPKLPVTGRLNEDSRLIFSSGSVCIEKLKADLVIDDVPVDHVFRRLKGRFKSERNEGDVWIQVLADSSVIASRRLWTKK